MTRIGPACVRKSDAEKIRKALRKKGIETAEVQREGMADALNENEPRLWGVYVKACEREEAKRIEACK